jgi:ribonucleotide reductase alpha subunit
MSGEFTVVNRYLVRDLKERGLWSPDMLDQLKFHDGDISEIPGIPDELKELYVEAFDVDPLALLDLTARRAKWVDQSQSHNVFLKGSSGRMLDAVYTAAWRKGLKTTYYLRTLAASQIEKSTLDAKTYGFTQKRDHGEQNTDAVGAALPDSVPAAAPAAAPTTAPTTGGGESPPVDSRATVHASVPPSGPPAAPPVADPLGGDGSPVPASPPATESGAQPTAGKAPTKKTTGNPVLSRPVTDRAPVTGSGMPPGLAELIVGGGAPGANNPTDSAGTAGDQLELEEGTVPASQVGSACSLLDPECEACQ